MADETIAENNDQRSAFIQRTQEVIAPLREELASKRAELETKAGEAKKFYTKITLGLFAGAIACGFILPAFLSSLIAPLLIFAGFITLMLVLGGRYLILRGGLLEISETIVGGLLDHFGTFEYKSYVEPDTYKGLTTPNLLPKHSQAECENHITGTYRGLPTEILEVRLYSLDKDNHRTEKFNGLLIRVKNPSPLSGSYALLEDGAKARGLFGYPNNWQRIKLESDEFEGQFDFVGTDQIEGRTVMTPARMEHWHKFVSETQAKGVAAVFEQGNIHIAIQTKGDFIDGAMMRHNTDMIDKQIEEMASDVAMVFAAIDTLVFGE